MRRRTFAASVVVTLSLAEAGCDGSSTPPEQIAVNPPPPEPEPEPEAEPEPKLDVGAKAEPGDEEPTFDIKQMPDGTCMKFQQIECPKDPQISCNPPPPQKVECPEDLHPAPSDPSKVQVRDDGSCWEDRSGDFECPKGAMCNPPPPQRVQCPS